MVQQGHLQNELSSQQKTPTKVVDPGASASRTRTFRKHKSFQEELDTFRKEQEKYEKMTVEQTERLRDDFNENVHREGEIKR